MGLDLNNPFRGRTEPKGPPPRQLNPKDLARVYLMGVVLIFVLIAMIALQYFAKKQQAPARKDQLGPGEIRYSLRDDNDPLVKRARELAAAFDKETGELDVNAAAFLRALDFARTELTPDGASKRAKRMPPQILLEESGRWRGEYVLMTGKPEGATKTALARKPDDEVGVCTLVTHPDQAPVTLVLCQPAFPSGADEWWEAEGIFLRVAAGKPLVLARNIRPVEPPRRHTHEPPAPAPQDRPVKELAAAFTDDRDSINEKVDKESAAFLAIMSAVRNSVTSEAASKAARDDVRLDNVLAKPGEFRGEFLRIRGRLVNLAPERLDVTNPDNVSVVHWGAMLAHPASVPVHFYMVDQPPKIETYIKKGEMFARDWVEIEGVFLRLYRYEGKTLDGSPGPEHIAPVLFVKNLRLIEPTRFQDPRGGFIAITLIIGGVLAVIAIVAGVLTRKYGKGSMRMRMVEAKRAKAVAEGKPLFPPPSPDKQVLGDEVKPEPSPPATGTATAEPPQPPTAPPAV